jgi:hypothetical protein
MRVAGRLAHDLAHQRNAPLMAGELARPERGRAPTRDGRVEQEDREDGGDRERDDKARWVSSTGHPAILVRSPRDDPRFPGGLWAVDGGQGPGQRGLTAGLLDHRVHHGCHDTGGHLLESRATLFRKSGKPLARTLELVLEDGLRMAVECTVTPTHLATTAGLGAGSAARMRLGAGAASVKPQNISAIPTSSPR